MKSIAAILAALFVFAPCAWGETATLNVTVTVLPTCAAQADNNGPRCADAADDETASAEDEPAPILLPAVETTREAGATIVVVTY